MKLEIKITKKETGIRNDETLAEITVNNGNWKYWENHMETTEKQTLTINNIHDARILNQPVKDAIGIHDQEAWKNDREIKVIDAGVRTYDNLLSYLNCRINNVKDCYKRHGWTEAHYTAVLFDEVFKLTKDDTVTANIEFETEGLIEIDIRVI